MTTGNTKRASAGAGLFVALALVTLALPALAADPVFPLGSRVGLVPPPDMVASKAFPGFEDVDHKATILIGSMPAAAYPDIERSEAAEVLKQQGFSVEKREPFRFKFGQGFLIVGRLTVDKISYRRWLVATPADDLTALVSVQVPEADKAYSDAVVRATLATLSLRGSVPEAEWFELLPFKVGNLAGFHVDGVLPSQALMLVDIRTDRSRETPIRTFNARVVIAAEPGGPTEDNDRNAFAKAAFEQIDGIKDVRITMAEPIRIDSGQGFETVAQAKDARTDADLMVVQWLQFGGGALLRMVGIARADMWSEVLPRLRTVRDGIALK